ncbi:MAG: efflux RND transporter periplasmic adaptor subunit [bacterium]|nr:efflux RND transporter periplasmic adaptor subunit [bacterium]
MKKLPVQGRTLGLFAVIIPLAALFIYVGLRSGPFAPVAVTVATVESRELTPSLFGIGTVEARYTYKIGPTIAGRLKELTVHVGDRVPAGQVLGEMDPVDLDDRIQAQEAVIKRAKAGLREASARQTYAATQARRYEQLFAVRSASEETLTTKRQELQIAEAAFSAAREELARAQAERDGLVAQRRNLRLLAPVGGIITLRDADPGTTIVAGQAVVEMFDPASLWINVRFDQISASGLTRELPAHVVLRSRRAQALPGHVLRVEPKADAVTEELLAKVAFRATPEPLPPVGELAEVTVDLPTLAAMPLISNAAVRREGNTVGVWRIVDGELHFTPVRLGAADLDGFVQVLDGLKSGDQVVSHSEKALSRKSRIHVVDRIAGGAK